MANAQRQNAVVELASALKGLDKQHPAALVVQRVSRKALVLAVSKAASGAFILM